MKTFGGPVLFINRSDINTDEIIPAKYLNEVTKEALKTHLLEDLKLEGFDPSVATSGKYRVVVTRENFGCGSSREHAPWALEVNDMTVVIATNFARIFRQNMFNCGMMAIELPVGIIESIFGLVHFREVSCSINLEAKTLDFLQQGHSIYSCNFELNKFDEALVNAGGWVDFADSRY
jgi:3-isopropylmalate/(R)-2-methylmalate dehydratase small subunit